MWLFLGAACWFGGPCWLVGLSLSGCDLVAVATAVAVAIVVAVVIVVSSLPAPTSFPSALRSTLPPSLPSDRWGAVGVVRLKSAPGSAESTPMAMEQPALTALWCDGCGR